MQKEKQKEKQSGNVASWFTAAPKQGGAKTAPVKQQKQQGQQQRRQQQRPAVRQQGRPQQQQRSVSHAGAGGRSQGGRAQPRGGGGANPLEAFMQKQTVPKKHAVKAPQGGAQARGRGKQTLRQQKQPQQKQTQQKQRGNFAQPPPFRAHPNKARASAQQRSAPEGASTAPFRKALSAAHQGRGVTSGSADKRSQQQQRRSNASATSAASDSGEAGSIWGNDTASIGWGYEGGSEQQVGGGGGSGWGAPTDEWGASGADAPIIPVTGVVAPEVPSSSAAAVQPRRPDNADTAAALADEDFLSTMKRLLAYDIHDANDPQMTELMSALLDAPAIIARQLVGYSEVASSSDTFEVRPSHAITVATLRALFLFVLFLNE